jgi:hypothetical protein
MHAVPKKIADRFAAGLRRFQPILNDAKSRDINESDTVRIITDVLSEVFGYDKYSEITSEFSTRGGYCDLAIKLGGTLQLLIEAKAVNLELKEAHLRQALEYASSAGTEWVVLTNGDVWRAYKVTFTKPIASELVLEFTFTSLAAKSNTDMDYMFRLSKEGWQKSALGQFHEQKQVLNKYTLAAILQNHTVLEVARRELRRISPSLKVEVDQMLKVLLDDVLKREVVEGEKAEEAMSKVRKSRNTALQDRKSKGEGPEEEPPEPEEAEEAEPEPRGDAPPSPGGQPLAGPRPL